MLQRSSSLIADFSHTILQMLEEGHHLSLPISVAWFYKCFDEHHLWLPSSVTRLDDSTNDRHHLSRSLSLSLIADFRSTIPRFYNCFNDHHIETWRKQRMESDPKCRFPGRIESNSKITARQTDGFSCCLIPQWYFLQEQTFLANTENFRKLIIREISNQFFSRLKKLI